MGSQGSQEEIGGARRSQEEPRKAKTRMKIMVSKKKMRPSKTKT